MDYYKALDELISLLVENDVVEKCMIIRIGNYRDDATRDTDGINAQTKLCEDSENCVLISTKFAEFAEKGLMKDESHYTQEGYNLVGEEAGENAAKWVNRE